MDLQTVVLAEIEHALAADELSTRALPAGSTVTAAVSSAGRAAARSCRAVAARAKRWRRFPGRSSVAPSRGPRCSAAKLFDGVGGQPAGPRSCRLEIAMRSISSTVTVSASSVVELRRLRRRVARRSGFPPGRQPSGPAPVPAVGAFEIGSTLEVFSFGEKPRVEQRELAGPGAGAAAREASRGAPFRSRYARSPRPSPCPPSGRRASSSWAKRAPRSAERARESPRSTSTP